MGAVRGAAGALRENKIDISPEKAIHEIKEIMQLQYVLPKSRKVETEIIQPTEIQAQLLNMRL